MEPRALAASSGLAPWSMPYLRSSPKGVTLANSTEVRFENDFTRAERKKSMKREQEMPGEMTKKEVGTAMNRWNREPGIRP
jgi:hypothetical protein